MTISKPVLIWKTDYGIEMV